MAKVFVRKHNSPSRNPTTVRLLLQNNSTPSPENTPIDFPLTIRQIIFLTRHLFFPIRHLIFPATDAIPLTTLMAREIPI